MEKETAVSPVELTSYVRELLDSLRLPPVDYPTGGKPGKMRGVDFYRDNFPQILLECLQRYHRYIGRFPEYPQQCKTLYEKLFWAKFFVPLPIPTPADKLSVGKFIPKNLRGDVRPAKVHWISDRPNFPASIKGPDGSYYLKTNNSWHTARRINYPIEENMVGELRKLGADWLARKSYNILGGEWWYSTIKPKLYIEEDIVGEGGSCPEYKFQCANGELMFIYHPKYDNGNYEGAGIFDADFKWVDGVELHRAQNVKSDPPPDAKLMLEIARGLARQFEFIRVDLYNPKRGEVILGELTISPGGGLDAFRPTSFDEKLGAKWDFGRYFL